MSAKELLRIAENVRANDKKCNASLSGRVTVGGSVPGSAAGSAAGSTAGSPPVSRRSSVSTPGGFQSRVPVPGPAAGSTRAPGTVPFAGFAAGSINDSQRSSVSGPDNSTKPASVSEMKPDGYLAPPASYPELRVDVKMEGVRNGPPVQKIVANVSGARNVARDGGPSPAASGVIADNRDDELKVVHAQLRESFEALEVELSTEKKKNEDWRVLYQKSQDDQELLVAKFVSIEISYRRAQEDAANYKESTESLTNRLYETKATLDSIYGEKEFLVDKVEKREGEIYELQQALQKASSLSTSSPGLLIDANEYQLLKEENTALKAQLSDKDKRIAELEKMIQEKGRFLVIPCNEGVNEGVLVTTGMGRYAMHAQQVQVSLNAGVGGKNDTIASETNSEASVDPGTVNWILAKIDTEEFVTAVIAKVTDSDLIPGVFVKKLQTVEGFPDVVRLLLKDLRVHDQAEFPRGKEDSELVESFARDIKNIHMNPADYDDDNFHAFCEHGFQAVADLSFIPGSTPTVNRVAFKGTEMDAELEKYTMKFHDTHVNQYLTWGTETSKKIRAFIMDVSSSESASDTGSAVSQPPSVSSSNSSNVSFDPDGIRPSDASSDPQANPPARSYWPRFSWGRGNNQP